MVANTNGPVTDAYDSARDGDHAVVAAQADAAAGDAAHAGADHAGTAQAGTGQAGTEQANTTHAGTEAHGGSHAEDHPTLLGLDAEGWVYAGVTIFLLLAIFVGKAHKTIAKILDDKIAEARRNLDEAANIRTEAEALLASAKATHAASANDASAIIARAEAEAAQLVADSKAGTAAMIARREKMATDKIAAAERSAVVDLRDRAASTAGEAARRIIASQHGAKADGSLVDDTIATLAHN